MPVAGDGAVSDADQLLVGDVAVGVRGCSERLVLGGADGVDEAGDGQQRQERCRAVGDGGDLLALVTEDAEAERGQQQPAERFATEE